MFELGGAGRCLCKEKTLEHVRMECREIRKNEVSWSGPPRLRLGEWGEHGNNKKHREQVAMACIGSA